MNPEIAYFTSRLDVVAADIASEGTLAHIAPVLHTHRSEHQRGKRAAPVTHKRLALLRQRYRRHEVYSRLCALICRALYALAGQHHHIPLFGNSLQLLFEPITVVSHHEDVGSWKKLPSSIEVVLKRKRCEWVCREAAAHIHRAQAATATGKQGW